MKKNKSPALKEQVYTIVKNRLLEQKYQDGQVLTERALAEEFRVSRTPVRAAMRQLQKEGWLRYIPHKGIVVRNLDEKNLTHIFQIRTALEVLAVRLACGKITKEDAIKAVAAMGRAQGNRKQTVTKLSVIMNLFSAIRNSTILSLPLRETVSCAALLTNCATKSSARALIHSIAALTVCMRRRRNMKQLSMPYVSVMLKKPPPRWKPI